MKRYTITYGSELVGRPLTKLGMRWTIWRFLRSKNNRYRQARRGNLRVRR